MNRRSARVNAVMILEMFSAIKIIKSTVGTMIAT
jgi:hypothetical protein